jgi:hypothetical protein
VSLSPSAATVWTDTSQLHSAVLQPIIHKVRDLARDMTTGITTTGFCLVISQHENFGLLGGPLTWGSQGACAWCDADTQVVYTVPTDPGGEYAFTCGVGENADVCVSIQDCQQAGPGYYPSAEVILETNTYVADAPGCINDICITTEEVTSTVLVQSDMAATPGVITSPVTTPMSGMSATIPSSSPSSDTPSSVTIIGGPCDGAVQSLLPTTCPLYSLGSAMPTTPIPSSSPPPSTAILSYQATNVAASSLVPVPATTSTGSSVRLRLPVGKIFILAVALSWCIVFLRIV